MEKKRIVFFGSGDFPRETFEELIYKSYNLKSAPYRIVGLVTSYDKCEDGGKTLTEIAENYQIPTIVVKDCKDPDLYEWCRRLQPSLFVVISFKKVTSKLLELVNGNAFNVHASLLPFLRGANPIRWAIRKSMIKTGLTAIQLSNKIDCGNIIANKIIPIEKDDIYGSLKNKMSHECTAFTEWVIKEYYIKNIPLPYIAQSDCGIDNSLFHAPKLTSEYFHIDSFEDLETLLRSVAPYDGIKCKLIVSEKKPTNELLIGYYYKKIEEYDCKIWSLHKAKEGEKTLINIMRSRIVDRLYPTYIIDEIQIQGKKRMTYEQFINGFKYLKNFKNENNKYKVQIELY